MPRNGNGVYERVTNWQEDRDNEVKIVADRHDEQDDDFADALTNSMARDGQSPATAHLSLGGFKLRDVQDPTLDQDAATMVWVLNQIAMRKVGSGAITPGVSSLDIETGSYPLAFSGGKLLLVLTRVLVGANNANLRLTLKVGGSWRTADYTSNLYTRLSSSATGADGVGTAAGASVTISGSIASAASGSIEVMVYDPADTTDYKWIDFKSIARTASNVLSDARGSGQYQGLTGAIDGVRIAPSSGTLSGGSWALYRVS